MITPDHQIVNQFIDPPTAENITNAVIAAGGMWVSTPENENIVENIRVYPNPIIDNGYISFEAKENAVLTYAIYDMLGKQISYTENLNISSGQKNISIAADELKNGMYFVKLSVNEKLPETIRFIVAK